MSKKRTSTESSNDEQTNEDSDVLQQVDITKRGKFASFSDTTLQDIPTEILQCILVKAIAMEVKNMKLAKSVWKEKADLVISRLGSVCSQWSSVLDTNFFRMELHRAVDGTAEEKIRMEILNESLVYYYVLRVSTMKDEVLMLCQHKHRDSVTSALSYSSSIAVYDRDHMKEVKEAIALPVIRRGDMAACNVSNCVYVLEINQEVHSSSILRIARDEEHKFNIQTWISNQRFPVSSGSLSVSEKGNLIIISRPVLPGPTAVTVYNSNGVLQHEVILSPDIYGFVCIDSSVIEKSNGNLVLGLVNGESQLVLTEIDMDGIIQRQYTTRLERFCLVNFADTFGRILIFDWDNGIELLDSEFNLLEFTAPQLNQNACGSILSLHFHCERNEVMSICDAYVARDVSLLRIFRFREE